MIIIGLFLFIAIIAISLNLHNQFNLDEIEEHLEKNNCESIVYSSGSYKALCDKYFISIKNSFTVDINKNSKIINYAEIKKLELDKTEILINGEDKIKFKTEKKMNLFFKDLEKKLK